MKGPCPHFQRSGRTIFFGFLAAVACIFLFVPVPGLHAGNVPAPALQAGKVKGPPPWVPYELKAINLLGVGLRQENFDPQGAVNTLRQARFESTAAITNGGGTSAVVLHNDAVIAEALMYAQSGAASMTENNKASQNQTNGGNNRAMSTSRTTPVISHRPVRISVRR